MIVLMPTDKLQAVLGGAVVVSQVQCVAAWRDVTAIPTYTPGRSVASTNSTTEVDVVASPAASTQRLVDYISFYNADTASVTLTVRFEASGTDYILWKGVLASLDTLVYENGAGFSVRAAGGAITASTVTTLVGVLLGDGTSVSSVSTVSATEVGYLDGVTSAIQTQLNARLTAANNLSDVASQATARTNLGLGSLAVLNTATPTTGGTGLTTLGTALQVLRTNAGATAIEWGTGGGGGSGDALVANPLSQFAATTSAELAGVISDETGTGALVFANSPTLVTPALGTPASLVGTNITGTASGLTAGSVTTNANLTGHVTSTGNAAVLGSFTKAQLDTAVSDGNVLYVGDVTTNATHTGDATGATALTLATVNSNVGSFGSSTQASVITVNAKGLVTAASNATVTPAIGSITGLGTGVGTALAIAVGSAGGPVTNGGALGTPSSGTLTNATGLPMTTGVTGTLAVTNGGTGRATSTTAYALIAAGTTATGAHQSLAAGATTEILVGGGASALPVWTTATGSGAPVRATSPTLVTPLLGTPTSGVLTNCTGTAAGLIAGNVTTNANLTGHITSTGNAAVLGSFTKAQLDTAVSDGNVLYVGDSPGYDYADGSATGISGATTLRCKTTQMPANYLAVGKSIAIKIFGTFTDTASDDDGGAVYVKIGTAGTTADTTVFQLTATASSTGGTVQFIIDILLRATTTGSSVAISGNAWIDYQGQTTGRQGLTGLVQSNYNSTNSNYVSVSGGTATGTITLSHVAIAVR